MSNHWLLPEFIADILPSEARRLEELRRAFLDCFHSYGYELVIPPLLEYIDSLLVGSGHDLDLRTFKLVDQLSGRTMGLRADITPQIARIDAHLLNRSGIARLCYAGSVLHTCPAGFYATREPLQIGAEIYGYAGIDADLEIQHLLVSALRLANLKKIHLDFCHTGILDALLDKVATEDAVKAVVYEALLAKDTAVLKDAAKCFPVDVRNALLALVGLYGDPAEILLAARQILPDLPHIHLALTQLEKLATAAVQQDVCVALDLADLRGYQYHTGFMFSAYAADVPSAVARGGRYDKIGRAFGRARPATGFSLDLREVAAVSSLTMSDAIILAPYNPPQALGLAEKIAQLRAAGKIVIQIFPEQPFDFDDSITVRILEWQDGEWVLTPFRLLK